MAYTIRLCLPILLLSAPAALAAPQSADPAQPAGVALVFGNGTYATLPALPNCLASGHAVAAALRRLHFIVVEQEDASAGVMEAALSRFTQLVQQHAGAPTVIYSCGYGTSFNARAFLLPVSATIARPTDALTQGILAHSILDTIPQANAGASLALLDVVAMPGSPADLGLATLPQSNLAPQLGLMAATERPGGTMPTPVAAALIGALQAPPPVTVSGVLQAVQNALSAQSTGNVAAVNPPVTAGVLVPGAAPPPTHAAAPLAPQPAAPPVAAAKPAAPGVATAQPSMAALPAGSPSESQMTDAQRRQVQIALAKLGYYDGKIDGIFGPDTRAAIRRWQFELHAPMTGALSATEVAKLMRY